jgi:glucokinase
VAGDVALVGGARGGVYIGGGIAPRVGEFLAASRFREAFEDKGVQRGYVEAIPTWLITAEASALQGAALALKARLT